ncbi:CHAT domain-containing protein [Rhodospirillales bacterium]|nr:CHAT domain-containing protein [Rhodospirillales bacterium]
MGEWKDGSHHGQGTYTYANGDKSVGEFKDGSFVDAGSTAISLKPESSIAQEKRGSPFEVELPSEGLPPRTITDVTTILTQASLKETDSVRDARETITKVVPANAGDSALTQFYVDRADAFWRLAMMTESIESLKKAAKHVKEAWFAPEGGAMRIHASLAYAQLWGGVFSDGIKSLETALEVTPPNYYGWFVQLTADLSLSLAYVGDINGAEKWIQIAREHYETFLKFDYKQDYKNGIAANIFSAEGGLAFAKGKYLEAEKFYAKAVRKKKETDGWEENEFLISLLAHVAETQRELGKLVDSELTARESLFQSIKVLGVNNPYTGFALRELAKTLNEQGRPEEAEVLGQEAVAIFRKQGAPSESLVYAGALESLAISLTLQNKYKEAYRLTSLGTTLAEAGLGSDPEGMKRVIITTNINFGIAALMSGDYDKAEEVLTRRLKNKRKIFGRNHYRTAETLALVGVLKFRRGLIDQARSAFKVALPLISQHAVDDSNSLASDKHRRKIILDTYFEFVTVELASLETKDKDLLLTESVSLVQSAYHSSVQKALLSNAARTNAQNPEFSKALRQTQDLEWEIEALYSVIASLYQRAPTSKTEALVEKARNAISKLRENQSKMQENLLVQFPDYTAFIKPQPISSSNVKNVLRDGEVLIITYVGENKTYVWALPKSGPIRFTQAKISHAELVKSISSLRVAVDPGAISTLGDIPEFDVTQAYGLYHRLLKPVAEGWQRSPNILFVGHGPLSLLPLSLLPTNSIKLSKDKDLLFQRYRAVPWLARTHSITMLPSVAALKALRKVNMKIANRQSFVGFGDPYFNEDQALAADKNLAHQVTTASNVRGMPVKLRNRPKTRVVDSADLALLPRLPETGFELQSIAASMGSNPTNTIFLGRQANEGRVKKMKLDGFRVLAFATHGLVPGDLDGLNQPALALSAPKVAGIEGDGLLTMDEIFSLSLDADWVVLSACNTASGDGAGAEAVSGLGRAFFYAGAKSLLVSNWPVHSGATAHLTSTLFSFQAKNKSLSRATALQKTRVEMIDQGIQKDGQGNPAFSYAHPIFWAPFTIIGDGGGATF